FELEFSSTLTLVAGARPVRGVFVISSYRADATLRVSRGRHSPARTVILFKFAHRARRHWVIKRRCWGGSCFVRVDLPLASSIQFWGSVPNAFCVPLELSTNRATAYHTAVNPARLCNRCSSLQLHFCKASPSSNPAPP
ncbi:hypothetical protein EXIGLDRAFT_721699, partial [Exidia glandulosa HHB12029]